MFYSLVNFNDVLVWPRVGIYWHRQRLIKRFLELLNSTIVTMLTCDTSSNFNLSLTTCLLKSSKNTSYPNIL